MPPLKGAGGDLDDERSAVDGVMSKRARHLPDSNKQRTNLTHSPPGSVFIVYFHEDKALRDRPPEVHNGKVATPRRRKRRQRPLVTVLRELEAPGMSALGGNLERQNIMV